MPLNDTPVFRKLIVPWYDSGPVCVLTIVFMDMVFLFSAAGFTVACDTPEYRQHLWLPLVLGVLSLSVIVSVVIRLIRRYRYRRKHEI